MISKKNEWLPVVLCLFFVSFRVCAGPLGDEIKKENGDGTKANVPFRVVSCAGLVFSLFQFKNAVLKESLTKVTVASLGIIISTLGIAGEFDSLVAHYFGQHDEKLSQKAKKAPKSSSGKKKKKKLRTRIKEFFCRQKR